ncbi:hypothetical protein B0H17DRAFT_1193309 [Mycena rosella]|uniref:Uncharacterized protein n=1 Tax=Mycena rosella TaxID=1033263 RepID=A0AAD7GT56_MYCRO|nr:hypothetical protein B0H17DRAFT_1193309 [Mycena rosella]
MSSPITIPRIRPSLTVVSGGLSLDALDQDFKETKLQLAVKRYFGSKSGQSTSIELVGMANS